jgi:glycosyltransferase involved in cell wall biosynthesis
MNILMFTNTFTPHVGGVARSVEQFAAEYRRQGHAVLIVAPEFSPPVEDETDVVRIPAIQNFNGSDFSVAVPIPGYLNGLMRAFQPEIVHSHHPFILGDTALRFSAKYDIPIVFTHHTQYEQYTHYVPGDSAAMKRFAIDLAVGYCNLCDTVIAPSATIRKRLKGQGVIAPIREIPTGVDLSIFGRGNGTELRRRLGIPQRRFVVGHVGRLAPEKGLEFLANAVARFVLQHDDACFLVAGTGPSVGAVESAFVDRNIAERLILLGKMDRPDLADVYAAMDVFAFASQSETQGMVLTEAMAAGTPVVAVDAPGVREVLRSCVNGILLERENTQLFVEALKIVARMTPTERDSLIAGAKETANDFSITTTAASALDLYEQLISQGAKTPRRTDTWSVARRCIQEEWRIWSNVAEAFTHAVT